MPSTAKEEAASLFSHLAEEQLHHLLDTITVPRSERNVAIFCEYTFCDETTLADIAEKVSLSRERVRQVVKRVGMRLKKLYSLRCRRGGDDEFDNIHARMALILDAVDGELTPFLVKCFSGLGRRQRDFIPRFLFGESNGISLLLEYELRQKTLSPPLTKTEQALLARKERLLEAICYPSKVYADTEKTVNVFPGRGEYTHITRFRRQLEKMREHLTFVEFPDIIYYSTSKTDYRPNFLLELPDGRRVLVLVIPTLNMAYTYNRPRFQALREFCKENGYGYLITDDRENTLETLSSLPIDPAIAEALDAVLSQKNNIAWDDIRGLKMTHTVTNATIAAYVLQRELAFSIDPYFHIYPFRRGEK